MRKRIFTQHDCRSGPLCRCWPCCRPRALYCIAKPGPRPLPWRRLPSAALTVTAGGTTQTLSPALSSTVHYYTVPVADTVTQITIAATPSGDGTVAYEEADETALPDADANTPGQQVDIPTAGKRINVVVTHTDAGVMMVETYGVLVIRHGPAGTGHDRAHGAVQLRGRRGLDEQHRLGEHCSPSTPGMASARTPTAVSYSWPLVKTTWSESCRPRWAISTR